MKLIYIYICIKHEFKKLIIASIIFINVPSSMAYAYIDPSLTLIIFQWFIAGVATVYAIFVIKPINFIKKFFSKDSIKEDINEDKNKEIKDKE